MSNYSAGRGSRPADPHPRLRLAALTAVIAGVVLLAAAAFVLSYAGIHELALQAGVTPRLARLYPLIFDAMLVIAGAAALALRGAGWWARGYAWFALLLLLAAVGTGDALRATHVALPVQPLRTGAAVTPWVLLLLAFGLWLEMLRHFRRVRAAGPQQGQADSQAAGGEPGLAGQAGAGQAADGTNGDGSAARTAVTWASAAGTGAGRTLPAPRPGLDTLLGPREGEGHYADPVSYGEETGYVHPESYHDHGDYPGRDLPADHEGREGATVPAEPTPAAGPADAPTPDAAAPPPAPAPAAQPDAAVPSGTAQTIPAEAPPSPPPADDPFPETPATASASTPWLERLRSTPAPPEE